MPFLLTFWKPIAAIVAVVVLLATIGVVKNVYDKGRRAEGRAEVQSLWDADKARRIQATTDQVNRWDAERLKREQVEKERDDERQKRAAMAQNAARSLPVSVAGLRVPRESVRVLNDAIGDPAPTSRPSGEPIKNAAAVAEGADSTVGLITQWGVTCIAAYDEARGMVTGWQDWYTSLRTSQLKGEP